MPMCQTVIDQVIQRDQHIVALAEVAGTAIHQADQFIDAHLRRMVVEEQA